jgi:hypothetical protein
VVYQLVVARDHEREKAHKIMVSHLAGRKLKKMNISKGKGFQQIVDTGTRLVDINEQLVEESRRLNKRIKDVDLQIDQFLQKLDELHLHPYQHSMVMDKMNNNRTLRWFLLRATSQQILDWIACNAPQPNTNPHHGFNPQQNITPQSGFNPQQGNLFFNSSLIDSFNFFNVNNIIIFI